MKVFDISKSLSHSVTW